MSLPWVDKVDSFLSLAKQVLSRPELLHVAFNLFTQFHFLIGQFTLSLSIQTDAFYCAACLYQIPARILHLTFFKINFKSLPKGIFFFCLPIFHFCGLLFASTYSETCAADRNTLEWRCQGASSHWVSRWLLRFHVGRSLPWWLLPKKAVPVSLYFRYLSIPTESPSFVFNTETCRRGNEF